MLHIEFNFFFDRKYKISVNSKFSSLGEGEDCPLECNMGECTMDADGFHYCDCDDGWSGDDCSTSARASDIFTSLNNKHRK